MRNQLFLFCAACITIVLGAVVFQATGLPLIEGSQGMQLYSSSELPPGTYKVVGHAEGEVRKQYGTKLHFVQRETTGKIFLCEGSDYLQDRFVSVAGRPNHIRRIKEDQPPH